VCVYVYAIQVAIVTAGIDVVAVDGRYAARAGKRNASGSIVGETPQFFPVGKVKAPQIVADAVIPIQQIDLAVFDNRSTVPPADSDRP
jgi:hypothetical protein